MPLFKTVNGETFWPNIYELYLSNNNIKRVEQFPESFLNLINLNLDFNQIALIEFNAFFLLKPLIYLSISSNFLKNISKNDFKFLFGLKYLNISHNQINLIEMNSFVNLNKLITLDLSFNHLHLIEADLFEGLSYLNDLFLFNQIFGLDLNDKSFSHLTNVGNIFMEKSIIHKNKCLFERFGKERNSTRRIKNKYTFYKSINIITNNQFELDCDLIFQLFQFRIHLNLKTDYENELFYEKCKMSIIKSTNTFVRNQMECFDEIISSNENSQDSIQDFKNHSSNILTDYVFYIVMIMLLSLLGPIFCMILNHLYLLEKERQSQLFPKKNLNLNELSIFKENQESPKNLQSLIFDQIEANFEKDQQSYSKYYFVSTKFNEENKS